MPNVSPKGLFGRHLGVWKPPAAIYARQAGVWKKVNFVYAMRNGVWQLIYASDPVAPASASAAWLNPGSVKVTIVPPAVNSNSSWIVRRSDGSIVATVPVATLTVTDLTPLLVSSATGNKTLAAYTVEGTDGATSSAQVSTNTVTWNQDAATVTTAVTYPTATTSTVKVSWTANATYGDPEGWMVWEATAGYVSGATPLAGSVRSFDVTAQPRGVAQNYRAVPFNKNAAGTWVQAGNAANVVTNLKATDPVSLVMTALSSPVSTLRLTWASGGGTVTAYEVETSTNGTTWAASADDVSPSDWSTTVAGYMRVRATSPGGVSGWVQKGPVTPINDTTPPATPVITSFKPESSYGRMVVRFTTANVADFNSYRVDYNVGGGAYTNGTWTAANQNTAIGVALPRVYSAGEVAGVRVFYRDDALNTSASDSASYTLAASPAIIDPTDSATWRTDEWRTDGTAGSTGVMHGRTSSGENRGCWFYGTAINAFCKAHDVVSATLEYCRDGSSQGSGSAIQPQVWLHPHQTQPAAATAPSLSAPGALLGSGVARSGTTGGSAALPASFIDALGGASYGLAVYRSTSVTDDANAASFYMRLYPFKTNSGGKISGRVTLNHLG